MVQRRQKHCIPNVQLSQLERYALDEIKRRLGLRADADAVRVGLFHLAKHAEIEQYAQDKLFQIRHTRMPEKTRFKRKRYHWHAYGKRWAETGNKVRKSGYYDLRDQIPEPKGSTAVPGADAARPSEADPGSKTSS